jgi:hypothetical protein
MPAGRSRPSQRGRLHRVEVEQRGVAVRQRAAPHPGELAALGLDSGLHLTLSKSPPRELRLVLLLLLLLLLLHMHHVAALHIWSKHPV